MAKRKGNSEDSESPEELGGCEEAAEGKEKRAVGARGVAVGRGAGRGRGNVGRRALTCCAGQWHGKQRTSVKATAPAHRWLKPDTRGALL